MKKAIKVITIAAALATVIPVNAAPYTGLGGCNMQIYKVLAESYKHYNDKKFRIRVQEAVEHQMSKHFRDRTLQGLDLTPALKQGFVKDYMELEDSKAIVKVFISCTVTERKKLKVEKLLLTVTNNLNRRK